MPDPKGRAPTEADFLLSPLPKKGLGRSPTGSDFIIAPEIEAEASRNIQSTEAKLRGLAGAASYVPAIAGALATPFVAGPGLVGALGTATVSGISGLIAENLRRYSEKEQQLSPDEIQRTFRTNAGLAALPFAVRGTAGAVGRAATPGLIRAITNPPNPTQQQGIQDAIELLGEAGPTVGQAARGGVQFVERTVASKAKHIRELTQQEKFKEFLGEIGTNVRGTPFSSTKEEYGSKVIDDLMQSKAGEQLLNKIGSINKKTGTVNVGYHSKLLERFYTAPEKIRNLMNRLSPDGQALVKGDYWDNQLNIIDDATGNFNAAKLINVLEDPNSVTKEIFSRAERDGMLKVARAAQAVSPDLSEVGRVTMGIRGALALLNIGSGTLRGFASRFAGKQLGLEIATNQLAKTVFMNPRNAAIAARLQKIPPNSAESIFGQRVILKALGAAGAVGTLRIVDEDGTLINQPVSITESGKFKPVGVEPETGIQVKE